MVMTAIELEILQFTAPSLSHIIAHLHPIKNLFHALVYPSLREGLILMVEKLYSVGNRVLDFVSRYLVSNYHSAMETHWGGNGIPLLKHFTHLKNSIKVAARYKILDDMQQ